MKKSKKKYTAYILSYIHGTVQIENKVYQPCTRAVFTVQDKPKRYLARYKTNTASLEEANRLLKKFYTEKFLKR